jgi:hypothetical protein
MKRKAFAKWWVFGLAALLAASLPITAVANSAAVSYQGVLRTSTQVPVPDGVYPMVFSIWDAPVAGTKRWGDETHASVTATNGLFSVYLGATVPLGTLFADYGVLYLEVSADTGSGPETYTPRVPLASVPYAQHAARAGDATTLDGLAPAAFWARAGNAATGSDFIGTTSNVHLALRTNNVERVRVTATGNVGVGTPSPNNAALMDLTSTTQGFAMPRMNSTQRRAIASPPNGLQVYDTTLNGFYYFNGTKWDCVSTPAGTVTWFAGGTAPTGYLECNGQGLNTTTFAELFSAIGYTYGGSGATFNVPDLRGEFIRGWDHARGVDPGRTMGSLQGQDFKTFNMWNEGGGSFSYSHGPVYFNKSGKSGNLFGGGWSAPAGLIALEWDGSEIRPRNRAMMPCIKY